VSATSGTSGHAKSVGHTQATTGAGYGPLIERLDVDEESHFVSGLAMYFATAYSGWTMSFLAGAKQTIMPAYHPVGYVELVEQVGGTHALLGPTPVYLIMDAGVDLHRLAGLRCLSMGGAACDPTRLRALTDALGTRITVQFGMTELAAATVLRGDEMLDRSGRLTPAHRSVGRPIDGLEVRLGPDGELELRGPVVTPGYVDDARANAEAFDDGWFRTGDVASFDDEGNVHILDRKKDLIVSGGINVAPLEVEQVLASHPGVLAAGVYGVADATYGEAVAAAVVLAPGTAATPDELVAWCRDRLAPVKKPRSVTIVDALPISSTGKLLRRELRAQLDGPREHRV
jgi:long-chain acyl-CoA synthetase